MRKGEGLEQPLFTFVHITDTHSLKTHTIPIHANPGETEHPPAVLATIKVINSLRPKPSFVLNSGDHMVWGSEANMAFYQRLMAKLEMPVYLSPGNHDTGNKISERFRKTPCYGDWVTEVAAENAVFEAQDFKEACDLIAATGVKAKGFSGSLYSREAAILYGLVTPESLALYEQYFGRTFYSFDHERCHFICLDSTIFNAEFDRATEQMTWLEQDLRNAVEKEARHTVIFTHYPLYPEAYANPYYDIDDPARSVLWELIEEYGVELYLCGHGHWAENWVHQGCRMVMTPMNPVAGTYREITVYEDELAVSPPIFSLLEPKIGKTGDVDQAIKTFRSEEKLIFGFEGEEIDLGEWEIMRGEPSLRDGVLNLPAGAVLRKTGDFALKTVEFRCRLDVLPEENREYPPWLWMLKSDGGINLALRLDTRGNQGLGTWFYEIGCWDTRGSAARGSAADDNIFHLHPSGSVELGSQVDYHIYRIVADGKTVDFYLNGLRKASLPDTRFITALSFGGEVPLMVDWVKMVPAAAARLRAEG
jgi:3',5'-cyclic AMP phosphodiesterase CpdA